MPARSKAQQMAAGAALAAKRGDVAIVDLRANGPGRAAERDDRGHDAGMAQHPAAAGGGSVTHNRSPGAVGRTSP